MIGDLFLLALCVAASAAYSGAEIGFYSLSRAQVDIEARQGRWTARLQRLLLRNDSALLVTILIGNNLALELATHVGGHVLAPRDGSGHADPIVVTLFLTPVVFFFGEALPKDLFRRRPHALTSIAAPFVFLSRVVYWPLERGISILSVVLERAAGVTRAPGAGRGREELQTFLRAGRRSGALSERAEILARNALKLRSTPIETAMVPWERVVSLDAAAGPAELYERIRDSRFTRLPVVGSSGQIEGYVHQLDVLRDGPEADILAAVRPMPCLEPDTPVDRALQRLRVGGHRAALVGSLEAPLGLVTLKDLVEEISGDLVGI